MFMLGPYVHHIDPIIGSFLGIHLWWYGSTYALGFLNIHLWLRRMRGQLGFSMQTVYGLTLLVTAGVLLGGRFVEVAIYEWPFYRGHPLWIPAYWLGGMSTHGLLLGAISGIILFCVRFRKPFLMVTDVLAVPAAFILAVGRVGNFIDGQIVGSVTDVWWAVQFPDAEGFRHPVVLYDGAKNLLLIPILLYIGNRKPPAGVVTGVFLFLYAFLRIFVDVFREYPTTLLGLATGQTLNLLLSLMGLILLAGVLWRGGHTGRPSVQVERERDGQSWQKMLFGGLLLFSLTLPSDWIRDIPERYSRRHPSLQYSALYPRIDTSPARDR